MILAVNHSHNIDGPMLMGTAPRPVHFLIKKEAFVGPLDPFLRGIGQLKVDRTTADRTADHPRARRAGARRSARDLPRGHPRRGRLRLAARRARVLRRALAARPIVPVAVLGSTERPRTVDQGRCPPLRSRVDVVFGDPFEAGDGSGRRTRKALDEATVRIQERLTAHLDNARRLTGR